MNIKKTLASTLVGGLVASAAMMAAASPAAAIDEGTLLPGGIGWFNQAGPLSAQSPATQIFGGTGTARTWTTLTTENPCPAGSAQLASYVRIPQVGVPENEWSQVPEGAAALLKDADGRFYTDDTAPRVALSFEVQAYNEAHGGAGDFPFLSVCRTAAGISTGYFRMMMHIEGVDPWGSDASWNIIEPAWHLAAPASSTSLAASATATTFGDSVTLTASVTPSSATGDVEFLAGTTSLGTATLASGVAELVTTAIPVGTNQVTAQYLGGSNDVSTSAPVEIVVSAAPAIDTTTTLAVDITSGDAYQDVTLTATVAPVAAGTCQFFDGAIPLSTEPVTAGVATLTTNALGAGDHQLTATFVPADPASYNGSTSTPVAASYTLVGAADNQTVTVEIPVGLITITTPYTTAAPLSLGIAALDNSDSTYSASAPFGDIVITDTRAGNLGFTASVVSSAFTSSGSVSFGGEHAGLTDLAATQVGTNALLASNVVLNNHAPFTDGLASPKVFATYAAGQSIGTAQIAGTFGVDQVPTSVTPGLYTATVTFTAV